MSKVIRNIVPGYYFMENISVCFELLKLLQFQHNYIINIWINQMQKLFYRCWVKRTMDLWQNWDKSLKTDSV